MKSFGVFGYLVQLVIVAVVLGLSGFVFAETMQFQNAPDEETAPESPPAQPAAEAGGYGSSPVTAPDAEMLRLTAEGTMYYLGKGVAQDYKKAEELFLKAAERGGASAAYTLGYMYENGQGVAKDLNRAAEFYKAAAEHDYSLPQYSYAHMLYSG